MNLNSAIAVQIHIPPFDKQGNINEDEKLNILKLSLEILRHNNPDSYIALSGHGKKPSKSITNLLSTKLKIGISVM